MLVISRKIGEAVRIGPDITVAVREIHGRRVKLVISAPSSVSVVRSEIDDDRREDVETHEATGIRR